MYHEDPVINDIVLTVINDGNGSQCGITYNQRCNAAKSGYILAFRRAANEYRPTSRRDQQMIAGDYLYKYYLEHIGELA